LRGLRGDLAAAGTGEASAPGRLLDTDPRQT